MCVYRKFQVALNNGDKFVKKREEERNIPFFIM